MVETPADVEQRIRERAHGLWEKEGCPEGRTEEFWHRARSEIESETKSADATVADMSDGGAADMHSDQSFPASDPPSHSVIVSPSS